MSLLLLAIIEFLLLILGLIVLIRNKNNKINLYFSLFVFSLLFWIGITYFEDIIKDPLALRILVGFDFGISAIALNFFFLFTYFFPKKLKEYKDKQKEFYVLHLTFLPPLVFAILSFTRLIVREIRITPDQGVFFETGKLFNFYGFFVIFYIFLGAIILVIKYFKFERKLKIQLLYVFWGFLLTILSILFFDFILPRLVIVNPIITRLGIYSSIFIIAFTSYSIIKHRLMDIRMVVARSVSYVLLVAVLAAIYSGSVIGLERVLFPSQATSLNLVLGALRTAIAVVMVFLFQPIKKWITQSTDRIFFKNQYDPEELLNEISHTIGSTIVLVEMLYKVNDLLVRNMKLSRSAFVIFKDKEEAYTSQAIGYKGWPPVNVPDFTHMVKKGITIYDELEENSIYKKLLRKYDAAVIVPIKADEELIGVYLAGEKNSGDMFTQQDIQIFEILAPEIAVGIENAKSYEEISKFNVTLRQEIKRATSRLKEKNEQLRELDKAKDEFISMASHQLRTPLTAIKGYLSMLLEGDAGEIKVSQYDFINEAYSAAGRMVGLINDLLNVSRMETGRFFLEPKEVDIEKMVEEEVKQLQNHAKEKGLYLKIKTKGKVPHIFADETKIRQVVMNFIDNAIYYTQNGGVTVKLSKEKDDFVFEVEDTGIGVPKEAAAHLFEKFYRADNARQTRPDGTGLGIYLAKRVVEDHGGKVVFHSEEGKGSSFGFRFPLKKKLPGNTTPPKDLARPAAPALSSEAATLHSPNEVKVEAPVGTSTEV